MKKKEQESYFDYAQRRDAQFEKCLLVWAILLLGVTLFYAGGLLIWALTH